MKFYWHSDSHHNCRTSSFDQSDSPEQMIMIVIYGFKCLSYVTLWISLNGISFRVQTVLLHSSDQLTADRSSHFVTTATRKTLFHGNWCCDDHSEKYSSIQQEFTRHKQPTGSCFSWDMSHYSVQSVRDQRCWLSIREINSDVTRVTFINIYKRLLGLYCAFWNIPYLNSTNHWSAQYLPMKLFLFIWKNYFGLPHYSIY